jgi:ADP-heptose:LPS heptosyltransferase
MVTPVLRLLKEEGWHITLNCSEYSKAVYENNPFIDEYIVHKTDSVPNTQLGSYWAELGKKFDRVINLSESIERSLLKEERDESYHWPKEKLHNLCNINYYDRTLGLSGFGNLKGVRPELYWSSDEETWAKKVRDQYRNRFIILWSLSGSAFHKVYHAADQVATKFLNLHSDAITFTVGGDIERLLEWQHSQNRRRCGMWSIRKSMIMTKYADVVVGSETGVMNASSCYDTPKIVLLSHSSEENLTKHWTNCKTLHSNVPCYPCHQLHYTLESCPLTPISSETPEVFKTEKLTFKTKESYPACMANLSPKLLYNALEDTYNCWKRSRKWQHQTPQLQPL